MALVAQRRAEHLPQKQTGQSAVTGPGLPRTRIQKGTGRRCPPGLWTTLSEQFQELQCSKGAIMRKVLTGALVLAAGAMFAGAAQAGHPGGMRGQQGNRNYQVSGRSIGYGKYHGSRYNFTSRYWNSRYGCYCYWDPYYRNYYYWYAPQACYYPISYFQVAPPVAVQCATPVVTPVVQALAPVVTPPVVTTVTTPIVIQAGKPIVNIATGGPVGPPPPSPGGN